MKLLNNFGMRTKSGARWRLAPARVELLDESGNVLGVVAMARSTRVIGAGAETVYLQRDSQPEQLRQSA
ncbi:MAG TPA: hypothetical protein VGI83_07870 [Gemmatimonadales bacterium]|jgi:hypothetical protein